MTSTNLIDCLDICLSSLESGADVETCLTLFPEQEEELRPILKTIVEMKSMAVRDVGPEVFNKGKEKVMLAAAELREQAVVSKKLAVTTPNGIFSKPKRFLGTRFYRLAVTTAVMFAFLMTGGTGLVGASGNAIPGDKLYPVKRSWEGVRLFFVLDSNGKAELEHEFDRERVHEIEELYSEKRIENVDFQGPVQIQSNGVWLVDGLAVEMDDHANIPLGIVSGTIVHIIGETDDGVIKASQIFVITDPGQIPYLQPESTLQPTRTLPESVLPEMKEPETSEPNHLNNEEENSSIPTPNEPSSGKPTEPSSEIENEASNHSSENNSGTQESENSYENENGSKGEHENGGEGEHENGGNAGHGNQNDNDGNCGHGNQNENGGTKNRGNHTPPSKNHGH